MPGATLRDQRFTTLDTRDEIDRLALIEIKDTTITSTSPAAACYMSLHDP